MAGVGGFAVGAVVYFLCGTDWVVAALTEAPAPVAGAMVGLPFGLGAAALAGLFVNQRRRRQARLCRAALNNMTQGLCMFDSAAKLVLCNERYIEMYHLRPDHARAGTPLRDLLLHRLAAGTFSGDVDRYVADCLQQVAERRTETKTNELKDGRIIAVVSRPMRARRLAGDAYRRDRSIARREGARFAAPARRAAPLDRCRDLVIPRPGRERAQDRRARAPRR